MNTPFFIVDAHMHLGDDWYLFRPEPLLKDYLDSMRQFGISRAYSANYYWLSGRLSEAPDEGCRLYEESEGAIPFLVVYHPGRSKDSLKAFDLCLKHEGLVGIKIHPSFHGVPADDEKYAPAWEYASEHRLPILSHTWSDTYNPVQKLSLPRLFTRFIEEHGDVTFVMGHSGGRGQGQKDALRMARKYNNVYLDIAGDIFCMDLLTLLTNEAGAEKILFGTDWPWFDASVYIPRILLSPLSDREKGLILGLNALRVFEPHIYKEMEGADVADKS